MPLHILRKPFVVGVLAVACRPAVPGGSQPVNITLNSTGDTISIEGTDVSRNALLEQLRLRYGIEVRTDVPDGRISPRISGVPLAEGIGQLLPAEARYVLRVDGRDRDLGVPHQAGEKKGPPEVRSDTMPTKGKTSPFQPTPNASLKKPPDAPSHPAQVDSVRLKPPADAVARVPQGKGPKVEQPVQARDSSLRLSFLIRAPDSVRLVHAQLVAGLAPVTRNVQGPLLFVIRSGGQIVHFGTILDPLEQHSYLKDGKHDVTRAAEGSFGIWIPPQALRQIGGSPVRIEFYDARAVTLPPVLDEKGLRRATDQSKQLTQLEWSSLGLLLQPRRGQ